MGSWRDLHGRRLGRRFRWRGNRKVLIRDLLLVVKPNPPGSEYPGSIIRYLWWGTRVCFSPLENQGDVMQVRFLEPRIILKRQTFPSDEEKCLHTCGPANPCTFFFQDGFRNEQGYTILVNIIFRAYWYLSCSGMEWFEQRYMKDRMQSA